MHTDNHADIHVNTVTIVFFLLKKNCRKNPYAMPPPYPKTFTQLNYSGIIRIKTEGIFV